MRDPAAGVSGDPTGGYNSSGWDAYVEQLGDLGADDEQELELCRILGDGEDEARADPEDATSSQRYQARRLLPPPAPIARPTRLSSQNPPWPPAVDLGRPEADCWGGLGGRSPPAKVKNLG